jgi:hypothetical protein
MEFLKYGVGWFIGIVAVIAGAYYFFYNKRPNSLQIETSTKSMIVSGARRHGQLTVAYDGTKVRDPYLVEFAIVNSGHKDITSKDFDAEKPLRLAVGAKAVAPLESSETSNDQPTALLRLDAEAGEVILGPAKLAVGEVHRLRLLVDGTPYISIIEDPLIDTKIELGESIADRKKSRVVIAALLSVFIILILQGSVALYNGLRDRMNVVEVDFIGSSRVSSPWGAALWAWINTIAIVVCLLLLAYAAFGALSIFLSSRRRRSIREV